MIKKVKLAVFCNIMLFAISTIDASDPTLDPSPKVAEEAANLYSTLQLYDMSKDPNQDCRSSFEELTKSSLFIKTQDGRDYEPNGPVISYLMTWNSQATKTLVEYFYLCYNHVRQRAN